MTNTLEYAKLYLEKGFSVIPLKTKDKKPAIQSWKEYQSRHPTIKELEKWFSNGSKNNIGIVTGAISGIAVVDLDSKKAIEFSKQNKFPKTPQVKTGKGLHLYYKNKKGVRNFQKRDDLPNIDLRGDGGYVVAPPSIHSSGITYKWGKGKGIDDLQFAELPEIILSKNSGDKKPLSDLYEGVSEGERNNSLARLVGSWVSDGVSLDECLKKAYSVNKQYKPPLDNKEVNNIVSSIFNRHYKKTTELNQEIEKANEYNYKSLLKKIADVPDDIERELSIKKLANKLRINFHTIKRKIDKYSKNDIPVTPADSNIIAHPSYEINFPCNFMSLGFKEKIVEGNIPKDRNIYIISTNEGIKLHYEKIYQFGENKIIFNEQNRLLIQLDDKWNKDKLLSFINNPTPPKSIYKDLKRVLKQYIEFKDEAFYGLIASWILATYFFRCFNAFPFLFFYGKKQSGKSRALELLERLAFNAMKIKGVSVAALSDSIDGVRGTFLNDQAESLSDKKNLELLGILADSYTIGGGKRRIVETSNRGRKISEFEAYSPKAFASIKDIDSDLKDRCIFIPMLRARNEYQYPQAHLPMWGDIRDKLYRFSLTNWKEVTEIYETTNDEASHRIGELWRPIKTMLILKNVSGKEIQNIYNAFNKSMMETQIELTEKEEELFNIIINLLNAKKNEVFSISEIAKAMQNTEGLNPKGQETWVGRKLKEFNLYDKKARRKDGKRAYLFSLKHVKDVFERYKPNNNDNKMICNKNNTTSQPPNKVNVARSKTIKYKRKNHLTTYTTCLIKKKNILESKK